MGIRVTLLAALFLAGGVQAAQEPEPIPLPREAKEQPEPIPLPREAKEKPEPSPLPRVVEGKDELPSPRVLGPMPFFPYAPPDPLPQFGRRDVWQNFGVTSSGRFVPRVINTPQGAYYLYNGRPFPYTTTQPKLVQPTIVD